MADRCLRGVVERRLEWVLGMIRTSEKSGPYVGVAWSVVMFSADWSEASGMAFGCFNCIWVFKSLVIGP